MTLTKTLVEIEGRLWQRVLCTPTALDGNGNCGLQIDTSFTGTALANGDLVGGEINFRVEDTAGGAPRNVFGHCFRILMGTSYADSPSFNSTISPKVGLLTPLNRHYGTYPLVAPGANPATPILTNIVLANSLVPFVVLVSDPRAVKLPATY